MVGCLVMSVDLVEHRVLVVGLSHTVVTDSDGLCFIKYHIGKSRIFFCCLFFVLFFFEKMKSRRLVSDSGYLITDN